MRVGISVYSLLDAYRKNQMSIEDEFVFMKENGCGSCEIADFALPLNELFLGKPNPLGYDPELPEKLKEYSEKYGVAIGSYSCSSNISRLRGEDYEAEWKRCVREVDMARRLGAPVARIDLATVISNETGIDEYHRLFDQAVTVAKELADYAASFGITLTLENHGTLMNGADRVVRLIQAVDKPNYGLVLDIGNTAMIDQDALVEVMELAPYTKLVHVKDFYVRTDPYAVGAKRLGSPDEIRYPWQKTRPIPVISCTVRSMTDMS